MGKWTRRLTALLGAACLLLGLAACDVPEELAEDTPAPTPSATPAPEPAQFALACYPDLSFHPISGSNKTNLSLGGLLYEGLFALDQQFQTHNVLCQSYTVSEDASVWTFTLRTGVVFSDGSALTAEDVAASLNQARGSALYASRLAGIAAVRAAEGAVTVTLSEPDGNLPALLDIPVCKGEDSRPLGTGPYVLLEQENGELFLQARADWWQDRALPKQRIPLRSIRASDELIHAFDTHSVTLVSTDLTGGNALGFSGSFETVDYPTSTMLFLGFNTQQGACQETAVRLALQRGADRMDLSTVTLSRHAEPAALPVPPACALYSQELAQTLDYSPEAMGEILTGDGWALSEDGVYQKGRERLELRLVVSNDNAVKLAAAEQLAGGLSQAGIAVELRKLTWEEYLTALEQGEFDLYLGEVRLTANFDLSVLIGPEGPLNYGGYADEEAQVLLAAFCAAGEQERSTAALALYRRLAEEPPFVVLCFKSWSLLTQWNQVSGVTPTQQNVFYGFYDWNVS